MLKKVLLLLVAGCFIVSLPMVPAWGQEDLENYEFYDFTFGTVVRISKVSITILEYDFEKDEDVEMAYDLVESTELINIEAISDLRIGDEIEMEFKEEEGKRLAGHGADEHARQEEETEHHDQSQIGVHALPRLEDAGVEHVKVVEHLRCACQKQRDPHHRR